MKETTNKALAVTRWRKIQTLLNRHGILRVEELADQLHVSAATVRRDLGILEHEGRLKRIHGGAMSIEQRATEPLFDDKTALFAAEKQRIAEVAHQMITPGDIIYLDGGSTVLELARRLVEQPQLTVVTNSLRVAQLFSNHGPRMILIGGEYRALSQTLVGALTRAIIEQMHFDIAFMGTIGATQSDGLTTTDPNEALTKELAMTRATRNVLLADSSKFSQTSFVRFGTFNQLNTIITDSALAAPVSRAIKRAGVTLKSI